MALITLIFIRELTLVSMITSTLNMNFVDIVESLVHVTTIVKMTIHKSKEAALSGAIRSSVL